MTKARDRDVRWGSGFVERRGAKFQAHWWEGNRQRAVSSGQSRAAGNKAIARPQSRARIKAIAPAPHRLCATGCNGMQPGAPQCNRK